MEVEFQGILDERKRTQGVVYASAFSGDGQWLACGDSQGRVMLWEITRFLSARYCLDSSATSSEPVYTLWMPGKQPVYTVCFVQLENGQSLLVSGGDQNIVAWAWEELVEGEGGKEGVEPVFEVTNPQKQLGRGVMQAVAETNDIAFDRRRQVLYSAAGNGCTYSWDLEKLEASNTFDGGSASVHAVHALEYSEQDLITGEEDGLVRMWDVRSSSRVALVLDPSTGKASGSRTGSSNGNGGGPWISSVAVNQDESWMVCGGGAGYLTMWHLASQDLNSVMPTEAAVQALSMDNDYIYSAGEQGLLWQWHHNGELEQNIRTRANSVFTVSHNSEDGVQERQTDVQKVIACAGNSEYVEVFGESGNRIVRLVVP